MDLTPQPREAAAPTPAGATAAGKLGIAAAVFVSSFVVLVVLGTPAGGAALMAVFIAWSGTAAVTARGSKRVILAVVLVVPVALALQMAAVEREQEQRVDELRARMSQLDR